MENLKFTFANKAKIQMDFLVFENLNQITVKENPEISMSSKESISPETDRKFKGKDQEDKLKVEDSEAIQKIKNSLKMMRRNLEMAIEDPEK
ncbi:hypothetical protein O181_020944 [Austropuccinia psidii MF-1]|uniref:Uncharacterized protein n=1 Tax=Austropuccinia psidii MF-1 TaxID=1389203 RepID=A0A9Q3C9V6_9BASI|nr:hypothetical protein [Austropuccinia psidii MF-1]